MSISSISSSLASLIDTTPLAQTSSTPSALQNISASSAPSASDTTLATDLAALLKDLVDGNVSASQTALTQLQKDLGTSNSDSNSTQSASNPPSPLSEVLAAVSHLLSTGNTSGALQGLVGYLRQTANTQGNLFSTTA